jgi:hypothetical protein
LCALVLIVAAGCKGPKQRYKPAVLATQSDVARYTRQALEHEDADVRRSSIQQIGKTRHADSPIVVDALAVIARTDTSESVRCVAVRALGKLEDKKAVDTILLLLEDPAEHPTVRPASPDLRWEAIQVLYKFANSEQLDEHASSTAHRIAIRSLGTDPARDVRLEAARLLGLFPDSDSVRALIKALWQRDFGVVYESERSLMRLTGKTHDHDPGRWESWLNSTSDPFAERGALDDVLDRSPPKGL